MNEMINRKKDEGFTLIELMIVIAVIGILAVVLVPRVGGIKTAAKSAGIDTNIRAVQAFVQSRVSYWSTAEAYDPDVAGTEIVDTLVSDTDPLINPFDDDEEAVVAGSDELPDEDGRTAGAIYVVLPDDIDEDNGIVITGIDSNGLVYSTVTINP